MNGETSNETKPTDEVKIRFPQLCATPGRIYKAGEEVMVTEAQARRFVGHGHALRVGAADEDASATRPAAQRRAARDPRGATTAGADAPAPAAPEQSANG